MPGLVDLGQDSTCSIEVGGPCFGELHASGAAPQQLHAELGLEPRDLLRQGRLRHVQPVGRSTEVQLFGDRHEALEPTQIH